MSADAPHPDPAPDDPAGMAGFGFGDDEWLHLVHEAMQPEPPGSIGDYEIVEEIRRGGQGVVYRATQPGTNRPVAIKRLLAGAFATKAAERRFEREIEAAAALRHPGIITVYGMEFVDGCPVMAMEWVDGVSVTTWAEGEGDGPRRDVQSVLRTFLRIGDAVEHAHHRGILHRDLKPSNILIDQDGRPRVLDFGLSKALHDDTGPAAVTISDGFCGTPAYASPEHLEGGAGRLDVRSDVYSLGVLLYEMLTGARPYDPDSGLRAYMDALDREAHRPPSQLRPGLGREIDAVLRKALAPKRDDRYGSVGELTADLRRFLAGDPVRAAHHSALYEITRWVRRHKAVTALTALLIASFVGSLAGFLAYSVKKSEELEAERDVAAYQESKAVALLDFLVRDMLLKIRPGVMGEDASVGDLLQIAVDRVSERFHDQPDLDGRVRFYLAEAYENLGDYRRAAELFRTALERMERFEDVTFMEHGACELALGKVLRRLEETEEAEQLFLRAERRFRGGSPFDPRLIAESILGLAGCAANRGRFDEMKRHAERGLELVLLHFPRSHPICLDLRETLATALSMSGQLDNARAQYQVLLEDVEANPDASPGRVAALLGRLSDIHEALLELEEARTTSKRSLELTVRTYGDDHPATAAALGDLAALMTGPDELSEAEDMLRRAKAITDRRRGEGTLIGLVHETRLAQNLLLQGRLDEAIPVLRAAYPRFEAAYGANSPWALRTLRSLARALGEAGQHGESIGTWELAMRSPPENPEAARSATLLCLGGIIDTHRAAGNDADARAATSEWLELRLADGEAPTAAVREKIEALAREYKDAGETELAAAWSTRLLDASGSD